MELSALLAQLFAAEPHKVIFSKPLAKSAEYKKVVAEQKGNGYQLAKYTEKQVFHENLPSETVAERCTAVCDGYFGQVNGWTATQEWIILISRKGSCMLKKKALDTDVPAVPANAFQAHNRQKNYLLAEGKPIAPLVDMGIFTQEGKVVHAMYDKFRQINRFIELIDDAVRDTDRTSLNIIDFGCGKSYLTFLVYYYFTEVRHISVNMIGLDLKADVIEKCNLAAQKYGYTGLRFELGDINGYACPFAVDMVMTLHACDTATDYALFNAIQWGAKMIFSVPCCQHELNGQMQPESLDILSRYGILQERFAAIATDAVRGNLLEANGYKTQLLEFIDFAHTPKNILIRAIRRSTTPAAVRTRALAEVDRLCAEFHFEPTLRTLLK